MKQRGRIDTISEYLQTVSPEVRTRLEKIREIVRDSVPSATETISYQMPAFRDRLIFIYFAAFKSHIGIYPPVKGDLQLLEDLQPYSGPKGNLRFPHDQPIPPELVKRVVEALRRQSNA